MRILLIQVCCITFGISNLLIGYLCLPAKTSSVQTMVGDASPILSEMSQVRLAGYNLGSLRRYRMGSQLAFWPGLLESNSLLGLQDAQYTRKGPPYTYPKFDEYGNLSFTKEKERLDYFAKELTAVIGEPGYIIEYRSKRQRQKPLARAKRAKEYLVKVKGIDAKRIIVVDGGYQNAFKIELRLGPVSSK